jgi:hypothetical protein
VRVAFYRVEDNGKILCAWEATRGKRIRVPGAVMAAGKGLPHDLTQYVIEAATGYQYGFWGLVARGATFKSTGRRITKPGRALISGHRQQLVDSEKLAGIHHALWKAGHPGPVSNALDLALAQWRTLKPGRQLTYAWPSPRGQVEPAGRHCRDAPGARIA